MNETTKYPVGPDQFSPDQILALLANLNPQRVAARDGMSYVEAHDIKNVLIGVFGFAGFSSDLISTEILRAEQVPQRNKPDKFNWSITAKAVVRLTIHATGATYTEAAIAGSKQPDFTESADMATKSAESDALKRAAIFLGTQFGLSLYAKGTTVNRVIMLEPTQKALLEQARAERQAARGAAAAGNSAAPQPEAEKPAEEEFVGYAERPNVPYEDQAPAGPESVPQELAVPVGKVPEIAAQQQAEQVRSAPPMEDAAKAVANAFNHNAAPAR